MDIFIEQVIKGEAASQGEPCEQEELGGQGSEKDNEPSRTAPASVPTPTFPGSTKGLDVWKAERLARILSEIARNPNAQNTQAKPSVTQEPDKAS